jgi:hypothetical protein
MEMQLMWVNFLQWSFSALFFFGTGLAGMREIDELLNDKILLHKIMQ